MVEEAIIQSDEQNSGVPRWWISHNRAGYLLGLVFLSAFLLRLLARLSHGEKDFWQNSYSLFYDLAENFAAGKGLSYEYLGLKHAYRPPVYPVFLWLTMFAGRSYLPIVLLQAACGASTAICAYRLGDLLFDRMTGLLAGALTAVYPYYVMHDTALQETGLFTLLTTLAVLFLLQARRSGSAVQWAAAGLLLGAALLTRATLSSFVVLVFVWLLLFSAASWQMRWRNAGLVALMTGVLVFPWLLRNQRLIGAPLLSSLTGLTLWAGNNAYTFSTYPANSIDQSVGFAFNNLSVQQKNELARLSGDEVAQNDYFVSLAWDYIKANKWVTLQRAVKKVGAAFSWRLNPVRGPLVQAVYCLSYVPILLLGVVGLYWSRRQWRDHSLIYAIFLSFIAITAVFFAHTSHRVFLDVYLIVFAAHVLGVGLHKFGIKLNPRGEQEMSFEHSRY